jgi:hypothetical protein
MHRLRRGSFQLPIAVLIFAASPAHPQSDIQAIDGAITLTAVSNRADKVSGGDALVRVGLPADSTASSIAVRRNGVDVTRAFRPHGGEGVLLGLVTGLEIGENRLEISHAGAHEPSGALVLKNHPAAGPVFSGPHEQPFICQTNDFGMPDGTTLGPPLDADCSVETVVSYVYRSTADPVAFKTLTDFTQLPPDVSWTTTTAGKKVPYVVRIETGTLNRAIYQIAVLHDPTSESAPIPFAPPRAWNGRLLYSFGGGCIGGWFRQGARLGGNGNLPGLNMVTDAIVGQGYAHASSTLNVFGSNCNDVLAAETMMMVKEHFIETYGEPLFTFGRGGSGGAYQQIQIADNYPGLLDGIIPGSTFPDVLATIQFLTDIQLLDRYFVAAGNALTPEQKQAIAGVGNLQTVATTAPGADRIKAPGICPPELPPGLRYHPVDNPSGARCNVIDHTVNVYGRDPVTGFARRPIDNTGVQYGVAALMSGAIDVPQFLDLNERFGGYDNDGNYTATRSVADPESLAAAYETGRIAYGGGGLATVPIIDSRNYLDLKAAGDLHLKYHSYSFRERLSRANGTTANQVLLVTPQKASPGFDKYTIAKMDEWLTNLRGDTSNDPVMDRIARARPADLVDSCYAATGERILEQQTFSGGQCNELYPTFPSPRMVAGGPVTNDVLKCQLKPVDYASYPVEFTEDQKARLAAIFPEGVCDWSKPGIGQRSPVGVWLSY